MFSRVEARSEHARLCRECPCQQVFSFAEQGEQSARLSPDAEVSCYRSGFRATSRFFPARSCAERSFALSLTAHERPVVGFHALFCPSHKVISGYVEFQGETLFIVKDPWPVDRGQYWFMTYEQIVSELEDNQSFGNIRKSIWDSCIVVSTSYANETVPVRIN